MKIKICGIAKRENLADIIKLKPDFMGFIFYPPSPRYVVGNITPEDLQLIPDTIQKTGVFVDVSLPDIKETVSLFNLNFVQLHGNESPEYCKELYNSGFEIIKAFRVDEDFSFENLSEYIPFCRYFLFDTLTSKFGGSGKKFNWDILKNYHLEKPFLLSGGIGPSDYEEILTLRHPSFVGIDINSRFEIQPGNKDVEQLKEFLENIRDKS